MLKWDLRLFAKNRNLLENLFTNKYVITLLSKPVLFWPCMSALVLLAGYTNYRNIWLQKFWIISNKRTTATCSDIDDKIYPITKQAPQTEWAQITPQHQHCFEIVTGLHHCCGWRYSYITKSTVFGKSWSTSVIHKIKINLLSAAQDVQHIQPNLRNPASSSISSPT